MEKMSEEKKERRAAIVTGGGTWLGKSCVEHIAALGHDVLIVGRREGPMRAVAEELADREAKITYLCADVTVAEDREKMMAVCQERYGRVDILVNNAGTTYLAPLFAYEESGWDRVHETNEKAPFYLSILAMQEMKKRRWGRIVNIGSVYGNLSLNDKFYPDMRQETAEEMGPIRASAYHSSKGGLRNLTRELAVAGAPMGITVNMVSPGMFPPDGEEHELRYEKDIFAKNCPQHRVGRPENIGHAVAYFLGEEASFTTGAELVVDGGWSIW